MAVSQTEGEYLTLHEFVRAAKQKLDPNLWDYLVGGTATETTLLRNRARQAAITTELIEIISGAEALK